jgi:hypothetical protein
MNDQLLLLPPIYDLAAHYRLHFSAWLRNRCAHPFAVEIDPAAQQATANNAKKADLALLRRGTYSILAHAPE